MLVSWFQVCCSFPYGIPHVCVFLDCFAIFLLAPWALNQAFTDEILRRDWRLLGTKVQFLKPGHFLEQPPVSCAFQHWYYHCGEQRRGRVLFNMQVNCLWQQRSRMPPTNFGASPTRGPEPSQETVMEMRGKHNTEWLIVSRAVKIEVLESDRIMHEVKGFCKEVFCKDFSGILGQIPPQCRDWQGFWKRDPPYIWGRKNVQVHKNHIPELLKDGFSRPFQRGTPFSGFASAD